MADIHQLTSPASTIEATLSKTTETLARSLAEPDGMTPRWSDFEWRIAIAVTAIHGVSALLCDRLRWRGPPGWERFLAEQKANILTRHRRIEQLLQLIHSSAVSKGLAVVPLKGAALHALGLYAAGERPMADIDLLVAERNIPRAATMIESLGFHSSLVTPRHWIFDPDRAVPACSFGEHADNGIKIELHPQITERLPHRVTCITEIVLPRMSCPGVNAYPSRSALMAHLLLHAAGCMTSRALRLLHLHDLGLLSGTMTRADWDELLRRRHSAATLWWALPPLQLTARYYREAIPKWVLNALVEDCPWPLRWLSAQRTLYDVSLSNPRVVAFPGIEWSRSPAEILAYVATRVKPSAEFLAQRKALITHIVTRSSGEWQHLSQGRRILRWLTSRPTRDETMNVVRAALAEFQ